MREQQKENGTYQEKASVSNAQSDFKTQEEEQEGREAAVDARFQAFRTMLPILLKQLSKFKDPRQAHKIKHKLAMLFSLQRCRGGVVRGECLWPKFMQRYSKVF